MDVGKTWTPLDTHCTLSLIHPSIKSITHVMSKMRLMATCPQLEGWMAMMMEAPYVVHSNGWELDERRLLIGISTNPPGGNWAESVKIQAPPSHTFSILIIICFYFCIFKSGRFGYMIRSKVVKVVNLRIFVKFKVVMFGWIEGSILVNAQWPICQFWWQLLIIHERDPRLHACFDKVNNCST